MREKNNTVNGLAVLGALVLVALLAIPYLLGALGLDIHLTR